MGGFASTALQIYEAEWGVNYGFDKVRFLAQVPVGSRVRAVFRLVEAVERRPRQWRIRYETTLEIEGSTQPALIADWIHQANDFAG